MSVVISNILEDNDGVMVSVDDEESLETQDTVTAKPAPKTEEELLLCSFCDFQATDLAHYVNHVVRPSHIKKAADRYNIRLNKETTGVPKLFHCQVCILSCNGENAWYQHLVGQKHRKILEKKSAHSAVEKQNQIVSAQGGGPMKTNYYGNFPKKPYEKVQRTVQRPTHNPSQPLGAKDFADYTESPLIGLEYVTEIQVIGQSPKYQCSLCDAKFDHNIKFPHLVGAKHRTNVLKIKRPDILKNPTNQTQKRSEFTAMLLREAEKLENEEGRQQVKTKVEKSPFIAVGNPNNPSGYRGARGGQTGPKFSYSGRGGYVPRGAGAMSKMNRGGRGTYTRGARGTREIRGARGTRGTSARGGRGYNRGGGGGGGYQEYVAQSSWSSGSFGGDADYSYSTTFAPAQTHGGYLPYNANQDSYSRSSSYQVTPSVSSDFSYPTQSFAPPYSERPYEAPSSERRVSLQTSTQIQRPLPSSLPNTGHQTDEKSEDQSKPVISSGLAGALGDLTKLVQNEDDASVALHVSNALTQALLQYRMTGIQDEVST